MYYIIYRHILPVTGMLSLTYHIRISHYYYYYYYIVIILFFSYRAFVRLFCICLFRCQCPTFHTADPAVDSRDNECTVYGTVPAGTVMEWYYSTPSLFCLNPTLPYPHTHTAPAQGHWPPPVSPSPPHPHWTPAAPCSQQAVSTAHAGAQ